MCGSVENLREDLERIREALGPHKKVDLYEVRVRLVSSNASLLTSLSPLQPARVDPKLSIEETMNNLVTLKNEGYFNVSLLFRSR